MIDIKGRNGYFKYDHKYTWKSTTTGELWIGLYSKREGASAPVVINGPSKEVVALLREMLSKAIQLSSPDDPVRLKLTDAQVEDFKQYLLGRKSIPDVSCSGYSKTLVPCVKYARILTGCGLKEAKDFIDQLRNELGI